MQARSPRAARRAARSLRVVLRAALLALLASAAPARAGSPPENLVTLRTATHDDFTRIVLDLPPGLHATTRRGGVNALVTFDAPPALAPGVLAALARLPALTGATQHGACLTLALAPSMRIRTFTLGHRRVIDLYRPAPPATSGAPSSHTPAPLEAQAIAETPPPPLAAPLAVAPLAVDPPPPPVLLFPPGTEAAAFARGGKFLVVFDSRAPIDAAALRSHPGFETAEITPLATSVVLALTLPPGARLALAHAGVEWALSIARQTATPAEAADHAIQPVLRAGRLDLPVPSAGHAVVIADPATGAPLLVGTVPDPAAPPGADPPPPHIAATRRFAEFTLPPTLRGVLVDPLSDRVVLHPGPGVFTVESSAADAPLALAPAPATAAPAPASFTRCFDLPPEAAPALLRRLDAGIENAAAAPALARLPPRRDIAQTLLALGMGPEAQAVLAIAAEDDPAALTDPATQTLAAAAALIAARLDQTDALAAIPPAETDEHRLWRGLRAAALAAPAPPPPEATASLAATGLLLAAYPAPLRDKLLPEAAIALIRGGAADAADRLLAAASPGPTADLARAMALESHGQFAAALAAYDHLAPSPDRSVHAQAAIAALVLRAARFGLPPQRAADQGEQLLDAWRGDARERDLWLRIAAWRGAAHQTRQQLETLREAAALFPGPQDGVGQALDQAFAAIAADLRGGAARLPPLDAATLIEENTDLLPAGPQGEALIAALAASLAALDLPHQAAAILGSLLPRLGPDAARAELGARLAALDLADHAPEAARQALAATEPAPATSPSAELQTRRAVLLARAQEALGNPEAALAPLAALTPPDARLESAAVHEAAHQWPQAASDLAAAAAQTLPPAGTLDPTQSSLVLRLASALAQSGDEAGLARLRATCHGRLPSQDDAALFDLLTAPPIRAPADLPRAAAEAKALKTLPATLAAIRP